MFNGRWRPAWPGRGRDPLRAAAALVAATAVATACMTDLPRELLTETIIALMP